MKKPIIFFLISILCFMFVTGCSEKQEDLSFHGRISKQYYGLSKCFKNNSLSDVTKELDTETIELHLSNLVQLGNDASYTEQEKKTAYVFYCYFNGLYKLAKADCTLGFAPQEFQTNFISLHAEMINYIRTSEYNVSDRAIETASRIDEVCDEYIEKLQR